MSRPSVVILGGGFAGLEAAFLLRARVPLWLTGRPDRPVEVRPGRERDYRVGISPLWRIGKKALGLYLPSRFRAGEPFHAGAAWNMMDAGLKTMSAVMAD